MLVSIFFIVLVAAFAVLVFFTEPSRVDKIINARLVSLDKKIGSAGGDEFGIVRDITFSTIPALDRFLRDNTFAKHLQRLIAQSDTPWTVGRFIFATLLLIFVGAIVGNWWIAPGLLGWTPGLAAAFLPWLYLRYKRDHRLRKFSNMLPAAIDLMSRGLRAGQALPATIETIANEAEDPVKTEFRRAADEQNFGLPFREALLNLHERVPLADLKFLVTAILVQKETGGNLVQVLDKASEVIRERERVEGQMRIRSAQGRLTGLILCILPFAMFIFMNILNPGYGRVLFEEPLGQKMVTYAAVMMVIGIFVIRKIVNVKI